ncbi:hypothetical protein TRFO_08605 [Tritrichomonas foetus]|uniref:VIT domain-containing protein n=1 Tax=Tritrichomonas foetus TaxID=1144522 RepID=A0A1J4JKV9_9EUKA|nr:hypothetical protein TRFO_08605 [Tritrichomonas foetus]|eukprot:OHS99047.1 hypothetical protein TRFO_08605 [Tritrichomonas foetus]
MTFPTLTNADTQHFLQISAIDITGRQNDSQAQLHVTITYINNTQSPIQIAYSPPLDNTYMVEKVKATSNGVSLGPVEKPDYRPSVNKSNSMELGLLDEQETFVTRLGSVKPGSECQLIFDITVRSVMTYTDVCQTIMKLTASAHGNTIGINEVFISGIRFQMIVDVNLSSSIVEITSNLGNLDFEALSANSGRIHISSIPTTNELDYSIKLTTVAIDLNRTRPRANSARRVYSYGQVKPSDACKLLVDAHNTSDIIEKSCLLAQAAHGYQQSTENVITDIVVRNFPQYDGDILTLAKNTGTEILTAIQPSAWIDDRHDSVFSPYEGYYIHNYLNMWNGRTFKGHVIHNLTIGVHSIICFVILLFSIVLWGLMRKNAVGIFFGLVIALYIGLNCYYIFRKKSLYCRRLNNEIVSSVRRNIVQFRTAIPPGYIDATPSPVATAGIFWKTMFFEPGFDVLLRLVTTLARNPTDPLYSDPKSFRSLMLLHRYIIPMVFAFNDEPKMAQIGLIVKSFRKVITNALLQGSEEIKQSIEQEIYDSLENENVRASRPMNLRHFTIDVPGILDLFKSISNAAAGRTGAKGEELRHQFSRLNEAIRNAERNGTFEEMKQTINSTPYLEYYS